MSCKPKIAPPHRKPRRYIPDVDSTHATLTSPPEEIENPDWLVGSN